MTKKPSWSRRQISPPFTTIPNVAAVPNVHRPKKRLSDALANPGKQDARAVPIRLPIGVLAPLLLGLGLEWRHAAGIPQEEVREERRGVDDVPSGRSEDER